MSATLQLRGRAPFAYESAYNKDSNVINQLVHVKATRVPHPETLGREGIDFHRRQTSSWTGNEGRLYCSAAYQVDSRPV